MTAKIKLNAASGGGSVSLEAPTSTTGNANVEFKLPVADGTSGQALTTNASGQLAFATVSSAIQTTSGTDNFTIADGNLVIGTSGHGIDFSADGGPQGSGSELLDDYEEGTFTPDWRGSNVLGTTTYGFNEASYVKIGNLVTVQGFSEIQSSNGSGAWHIDNMPFNTAGDRAHRCVGTVQLENFNFDSDVVDILLFIDRNNNNLILRGNRDNATPSSSLSPDNDTGWQITWCITYRTA